MVPKPYTLDFDLDIQSWIYSYFAFKIFSKVEPWGVNGLLISLKGLFLFNFPKGDDTSLKGFLGFNFPKGFVY